MTTNLLADLRHEAEKTSGASWGEHDALCAEGSLRTHSALALREDLEFRDVHLAEAIARSSYLKVLDRLGGLSGLAKERRDVLLPMGTQRLTTRIVAEEQHCLKLIKRTHQLIATLKSGENGDEAVSPKAKCLRTMRDNLATLLTLEISEASQDLVAFRMTCQEERLQRTRRLLVYAFPEATDFDVDAATQYPEIAEAAVEKRLCEGEKCPRLDVVIAELDNSKAGLQKRLEAESTELELMFFQFTEIVGKNDTVLTGIEQNIANTLQHTEAAVQNLKDAKMRKLQNQRRILMMQCCCGLMVVYLLFSFLGPLLRSALSLGGRALVKVDEVGEHPHPLLADDVLLNNELRHGVVALSAGEQIARAARVATHAEPSTISASLLAVGVPEQDNFPHRRETPDLPTPRRWRRRNAVLQARRGGRDALESVAVAVANAESSSTFVRRATPLTIGIAAQPLSRTAESSKTP
eukprot:TRINITY_DN74754_c0_g1_i1.p1 TRINITY_DN74754_c0_g1~~TRINITY_DN74754_c0_g1_i1.p1  ORF type:complete len:466 (-),score=89.25 TRINITY_DN74754_c0_g1_i1:164-1561(-)